MKVAILGLAQSTRHLVPWGEEGWEVWGLAWDSVRFDFDRAFEMHDWADLEATHGKRLGEYLEKVSHCRRLYMPGPYLTDNEVYPFDAVAASTEGYWCSSIAYMFALALHEKAEEIALYGVNMGGDRDEYAYQRPNMEYLIGLARGRGVRVTIPEASPLCKFQSPHDRDYDGRYGRTK